MKRTYYILCPMLLFMAIPTLANSSSYQEQSKSTIYSSTAAPLKSVPYAARLLEQKAKNYIKLKKEQQFVKTLEQGITKYPEDTYFIKALDEYNKKQNKAGETIAFIDNLIATDTSNKGYSLAKAVAYNLSGEYEKAKATLQQNGLTDIDDATANNLQGEIAYNSKHYDEAETYFSKSLKLSYQNADANYGLGLTYFKQEKYFIELKFI